MTQWRKFSVSIFLICLLEFVFWAYCTVSAAGAAEEMYMVKGIETFKNVDGHDDAARLGSAQEAASLVERTSNENNLKEADVHHHGLGLFANTAIDGHNSVGRLGVWIAVAVGLLGFKWLFPHYVKKVQELLAHPYEFYQMLKFKFFYKVPSPSSFITPPALPPPSSDGYLGVIQSRFSREMHLLVLLFVIFILVWLAPFPRCRPTGLP